MTETSPAILNDEVLANNSALDTDEIERNVRIIITKLKGKYMNEGRISIPYIVTYACHCILSRYGVFNGIWMVYEVFSNLIVIPLQMVPEWIN